MRSEVSHVVAGDLVRLKFPRRVDDLWQMKTLISDGKQFHRCMVSYETLMLYIGRLSSNDEIDASYHGAAPGDEAGYTPVFPYGWFLSENNTILAINVSFVEPA